MEPSFPAVFIRVHPCNPWLKLGGFGRVHQRLELQFESRRDRRLPNLTGFRVEFDMNDRERTGGEERTRPLFVRENPKPVAQTARANLFDAKAGLQGLLKPRG